MVSFLVSAACPRPEINIQGWLDCSLLGRFLDNRRSASRSLKAIEYPAPWERKRIVRSACPWLLSKLNGSPLYLKFRWASGEFELAGPLTSSANDCCATPNARRRSGRVLGAKLAHLSGIGIALVSVADEWKNCNRLLSSACNVADSEVTKSKRTSEKSWLR